VKIDGMFKSRQDEIAKMEADFQKTVADFQNRAPMLAAEARAAEENKLMGQQRSLQQTAMQYEQEMQQQYMAMLGELDVKMRTVAADVGKTKACTVVLDSAIVVYAGPEVVDVTLDLVARYNSVHK
jgi:outer membrane protein